MATTEEPVREFLNIRFPMDLRNNVEHLAEIERRPLSQMAMILIEEAISARSKRGKKQ